jgi:putative transposase
MPNHVHGIAWLREDGKKAVRRWAQRLPATNVEAQSWADRRRPKFEREAVAPLRSGSLGEYMRVFKSLGTKRVNAIRGTPGLPVWQEDYYERIVRNEAELADTRQYILDNPANWNIDPDNPAVQAA